MHGQCQARVSKAYGGHRCQHAAKHTHHVDPITVKVCEIHLRTLLRRERLGSEQTLLDRWNT